MFLHRFSKAVAAASFAVIVAGSSVTGLGLVPGLMGDVFAGHRVVAALLGILTVGLAIAFLRAAPSRAAQALALVALAVIAAQGVLGRFNVLEGLPGVLSTTHSGLAQIYFALVVTLAVMTSEGWKTAYAGSAADAVSSRALVEDGALRKLAVVAIVAVYLQIALGAMVRHTGAAHAIPDYPLAFGRLAPPIDSFAIPIVALSFAHRIGALLATALVAATAWRILSRHRGRRELMNPAMVMLALVALEIALGAAAVLGRSLVVGSGLVGVGALLLAVTVVVALRVHRPFFRTAAVVTARA